jgi:hypothetical protein
LGKPRLIAEVRTPAAARKVEETVKTGYLEATIDTLTNWIGVEEDLADSYDELADKGEKADERSLYKQLSSESRKNIEQLQGVQKTLEGLNRARVQRVKLLASLSA